MIRMSGIFGVFSLSRAKPVEKPSKAFRLFRLFPVQHLDCPKANILITGRSIPAFPAVFRAAIRSVGNPRTTLDTQHSDTACIAPHRRSPLPDIAPKVNRAMRPPRNACILLDRRPAVMRTAVKISVLRHMTRCKFPFTLAGQRAISLLVSTLSSGCSVSMKSLFANAFAALAFIADAGNRGIAMSTAKTAAAVFCDN